VNVSWPVAVAVVSVEKEAGWTGASHAAGSAGALDEILTVVGDTDGLPGCGALAGFWLGRLSSRGFGARGMRMGATGMIGVGLRGFDGDTSLEENVDDGTEKRVFAFAAEGSLEVVEIQGPDHTSAQTLILDVLSLDADGSGIVVGDPLITSVSVHDFMFGMILGGPA